MPVRLERRDERRSEEPGGSRRRRASCRDSARRAAARFAAWAPTPVHRAVRDGVRAALPLVLGPVLFGLTFGVLAEAAGMSVAAAVVMSATTFAGSAQFAAASVLEDGGTAFAAIVSAVLLNARYAGMSIAVASIFPGGRARRFLESQLIVDESWALSGRSGRFEWPILVGAGLFLYVLWVVEHGSRNGRRRRARRSERPRARRGVRRALPRARAAVPAREARARGGGARRPSSRSSCCRSLRQECRWSWPRSPACWDCGDERRVDRGDRRRRRSPWLFKAAGPVFLGRVSSRRASMRWSPSSRP